ncbi:thioesterase II family protein [Streptomyces sp. NPDC003247]|uniref:thioesterase II family protein n=1 Tax=Streptomyces sp. NPDC003247 TaxID=3364677 RepID=UPI0036C4A913
MAGEWIRRLGPPADRPGAVQLVCFPHAGGAAGAYTALCRALAPTVEVVGVQYPARQDRLREEPVRDVRGLAERVARELGEDAGSARPRAFFGHSMGALVAFETALLLGRDGPATRPVRLFLSGRAAPSLGPGPSDHLAGDAELLAELRRLGGVGDGVLEDPDVVELIMPAVRADYQALAAYSWRPGTTLDRPLTVLVGDTDPIVTREGAAQWRRLSTAPTEVRSFTGGHFYLDDRVQQVAEVVRDALVRP